MTTFTSGAVLALTLDQDDRLTFVGSGSCTVTPTYGSSWVIRLDAPGTVIGPFRQNVSLSITTTRDGSYTTDNYGDQPTYVTATTNSVTGGIEFNGIDPLNPGKRVLGFGTSITNKWGTGFAGTAGDYSNVQIGGDSYLFWACVANKFSIDSIINKGVSSDTTALMLARYATDVTANLNLFDVMVFEPGPNDYSVASPDVVATKANIASIISQTITAGKPIILLTPTPSEFITTAIQRNALAEVTNWIKTTYRSLGFVYVVDTQAAMADAATGSPLSVLYTPTTVEATRVHPSMSGGQLMGRYLAQCDILQRLPIKYQSSGPRDHREYLANPRLSGSNTAGTANFQIAGLNVAAASGGPFASAFAIAAGAFTSATLTPLASTGANLSNGGGVQLVCAGATSNFDRMSLRVGSTDAIFGLTQVGRCDLTRINSTAYALGDRARLATPTDGFLLCITAGTSHASVVPTPTTYGEQITDGTVTWMWQKIPVAGDVFVSEVEYEITSVTSGVLIQLQSNIQRASTSDGERFGFSCAPFADRSASISNGLPNLYMPRTGVLRSLPITLINPGVSLRHIFNEILISFPAGGGATINIYNTSLRRISA